MNGGGDVKAAPRAKDGHHGAPVNSRPAVPASPPLYAHASDLIAEQRALRAHERRTAAFIRVLKYDEPTAAALAVLHSFGTLPERDDA